MVMTRDIQFLTPDNRRQIISRVRVTAKFGLQGRHQRYNINNFNLEERYLKKIINECFEFNQLVKFSRQGDPDVSFVVLKKNRTYYINGDKISGKNLCRLINFIFVKFNAYKNKDEIDDDIVKFQEIDPLITDVIINKLEYQYYSDSSGRFESTLLNMQIIGKDTVAFELYSDKWIPLSFKDAIQFIRACKGGENKFFAMPFQELYRKATGKFLTSSEEKLIDAFLLQNRSANLVTKRSMELVDKLSTFPAINRLEIHSPGRGDDVVIERGLHIRGKGGSWVVSHHHEEGQHVLGRQNVKTQFLMHLVNLERTEQTDADGYSFYSLNNAHGNVMTQVSHGRAAYTDGLNFYLLGGSICIDQMDNNISLGDQIASRSLLLMNDVDNISKVSTLQGFGKSMGAPRNKEVIKDGMLVLRQVNLTDEDLRKLLA